MQIDRAVQEFLALKRIAVVGVSRKGASPANAIATRFREGGYEVFAINRSGDEIDGHPTWRSLGEVPGGVDGVVVVTNPSQATAVAAEAAPAGARWIWFHQGFGPVSYNDETLATARGAGVQVIAAACPMMYLNPDGFHRCARGVFRWLGRIPREIEGMTEVRSAP